ncbi:hypothetical protein O181_006186 [Austropuccinia psidii MF-1]|uniref:Uncharacterized protein n=1 Tax=Austropuccinia psidii MF-1 TaxID=1389203 RepID=A0A9Q3BIP9_9BASI|nr:hypothetical protein [Austropuccinia psidii MF-1]
MQEKKCNKSIEVPELKVGDLTLASKLNFNDIKGPENLKDSDVGQFFIISLHGTNAVQVELSGDLKNQHPNFPVSLINYYQLADKELFPLKKSTPLTVLPVEHNEE